MEFYGYKTVTAILQDRHCNSQDLFQIFSDINISEGREVRRVRCGGIFIRLIIFTTHLLLSLPVKDYENR